MGFETVILDRVAEVLGNPHQAEFTNGTLFVSGISAPEAEALKAQLTETAAYKIDINQVGVEFAFDFM